MALTTVAERGDASSAPEIVIYSVGSDGMEASRDILSLDEAERLILSVRRAISASRPETVIVGHRPVQGSGNDISAGYHGYWITDFTQVDPHFGTIDDLRTLIRLAHGRGMKIYLDLHVRVQPGWREKSTFLNALDWRTMAGEDES